MKILSVLHKMPTEITSEVQYYLEAKNHVIHLNQHIGKSISITLDGFQCVSCDLEKKIYRQGHCYECFYQSAATADWIIKPEMSKAHLGIEERDLDYEMQMQLQPHVVYLALSSNVKVGVTRKSQIPTRWIDQGANKALPIVEVPNRYLSGITEVALKAYVSDKTSWQKMLKNDVDLANLEEVKNDLKQYIPEEVLPFFIEENHILEINYPVSEYPIKVKSLNLEKEKEFTGTLLGIKGQYLMFVDGTVFNVRSNEGYRVFIEIN